MSGLKSLKKKRRIQIIVLAFVALALSAGLIGYGFRDGINFYRDPTDVIAAPPPASEVFRLGGLVEEGSLVRGESETITFNVTDGAEVIPVTYTGILPDLFGEHDEDYMPKEVLDSLKDSGLYVDPNAAAGES
jgi:cytochrome c-type biogenesis protein CcmE